MSDTLFVVLAFLRLCICVGMTFLKITIKYLKGVKGENSQTIPKSNLINLSRYD